MIETTIAALARMAFDELHERRPDVGQPSAMTVVVERYEALAERRWASDDVIAAMADALLVHVDPPDGDGSQPPELVRVVRAFAQQACALLVAHYPNPGDVERDRAPRDQGGRCFVDSAFCHYLAVLEHGWR